MKEKDLTNNNIAALDNSEGEDLGEEIPTKRKKSNGWSSFIDKNSKFETVILFKSGDEYLKGFDESAVEEFSNGDCSDSTKILENDEQTKIPDLQELEEPIYVDITETNNNQEEKNTFNGTRRRKSRRNLNKNRSSQEESVKVASEGAPPTYVKQSQKFLALIEKSNADYEQQNILLENRIEKVKQHVEKIEEANMELDEEFKLFHIFSQQIENRLVQAFSKLPIPNEPHGASSVNIFRYMTNLYALHTSNDSELVEEVKKIIGAINMNVNLRDFL